MQACITAGPKRLLPDLPVAPLIDADLASLVAQKRSIWIGLHRAQYHETSVPF